MNPRFAFVLVLAGFVGGCGGSPEPYETKGGPPTRLDGETVSVDALEVSEALRAHPRGRVYVRGFLYAPRDEKARLCTRLEKDGLCEDPSLVLDASAVNLDAAPALESGCCAIGLWSPRPVVLRLDVRGRSARILG